MPPSPLVLFCTQFHKNKKMGFSLRQNNVLKVVHPGRHVEVFREPITAGEVMRKYPRHCITRPDVFKFPWIVVRPESLLVPGKVFYLVPYHTMNNLLKAKIQQIQSSNHHLHYLNMQNCHMNSLAGVTPKHQHYDRYHMGWTNHMNLNDQESCQYPQGKDSYTGRLYRLEFYRSWNKMRRKRNHGSYYERLYSEPDSPLFSIRPSSNEMRTAWGQYSSPEESKLIRLKPCLRKPDSVRQKLNLKVSFAGGDQQDALILPV